MKFATESVTTRQHKTKIDGILQHKVLINTKTSKGLLTYPTRHPIIPYAFENEKTLTI